MNYFQTPFEPGGEDGELIFVTVRLNGEDVPFVLDTGAPSLVLNAAHFPAADIAARPRPSYGVSGSLELRSITIDHFDWHGVEMQEVAVTSIDLSHMEAATESRLVGLIGFDPVKEFEVLIDYEARQLTLFRPGAANFHQTVQSLVAIPFTLEAHIPVVDVEIGGQAFRLGLDTGAGVNLLDTSSFGLLEAAVDYEVKATDVLWGADKNETTVQLVEVENTRVGSVDFTEMVYSVADISHLNNEYGPEIDGLLGYPFLSQRKMSINFADQKIHLWDAVAEISPLLEELRS